MRYSSVAIAGLKMRGWRREDGKYGKRSLQLSTIGKVWQRANSQVKACLAKNASYEHLCSRYKDALAPVKLQFFLRKLQNC